MEDAPEALWQGQRDAGVASATKVMNPAVPQELMDEAYEDDAANAAAEYGAQFRSDVESFVSIEAIDACTVPGRHELPPMST